MAAILSEDSMPRDTARLHTILQRHVGKANAISMAHLYRAWANTQPEGNIATLTRAMRKLIDDLRDLYGVPVMSSSHVGYWIAGNPSEVADVCREFRARGLKSLATSARLRKISLADEVMQIQLELLHPAGPAKMLDLPEGLLDRQRKLKLERQTESTTAPIGTHTPAPVYAQGTAELVDGKATVILQAVPDGNDTRSWLRDKLIPAVEETAGVEVRYPWPTSDDA